jgi:hypothetical protein
LISKGGGGSSQVLSRIKVLAIDLAFASICDLLRGGMPFCGKVATKNKDMLAFDLSFLLGVQTRFFVHTCYLVFYLKT